LAVLAILGGFGSVTDVTILILLQFSCIYGLFGNFYREYLNCDHFEQLKVFCKNQLSYMKNIVG
jgi:hypothetical protein